MARTPNISEKKTTREYGKYEIERLLMGRLRRLNPRNRRDQAILLPELLDESVPDVVSAAVGIRFWTRSEERLLTELLNEKTGLSLIEVRSMLNRESGFSRPIRMGALSGRYSLYVIAFPRGNGAQRVFVVALTSLRPDELFRLD